MISNKKLNQIIPELFIRGRKLDFSIAFLAQFYFIQKDVGLNYTFFYYENSKQTRASANRISSFIRYWL